MNQFSVAFVGWVDRNAQRIAMALLFKERGQRTEAKMQGVFLA